MDCLPSPPLSACGAVRHNAWGEGREGRKRGRGGEEKEVRGWEGGEKEEERGVQKVRVKHL